VENATKTKDPDGIDDVGLLIYKWKRGHLTILERITPWQQTHLTYKKAASSSVLVSHIVTCLP
jgi:hypothetical protein